VLRDLLVVDPALHLDKVFNSTRFKKTDLDAYAQWLADCFDGLLPLLKPTASVYICSDWQSSPAVFHVAQSRFHVRNRITWEREKGRGARHNWKNASEDVWFCTASSRYTFNVEAVKLKRRVLAPPQTLESTGLFQRSPAASPPDSSTSRLAQCQRTAAPASWPPLKSCPNP
jgi:site-specific DNA-methyltransferase (adenine-specific)